MTLATVAPAGAQKLAAIQALSAAAAKLGPRDQDFAANLIRALKAGKATDKQLHWVQVLIERGNTPKAPRQTAKVGDMGGLLALFDRAGKTLKRPAISARAGFGEVRLSVAGPGSSRPGTINVTDGGGYGEGKWYGRITRDGTFEPSREQQPGLVEYLTRFAAEPAKVAAESGHLSGRCCFCNRGLDDARSTAVGYGPICADRYGLAWG